MIVNRLEYFRDRKEPQKHEKYEETVKYRKSDEQKKKLYDYYKCDYCNAEIEIKKKRQEMGGRYSSFPQNINKMWKHYTSIV